MQQNVIKLLAVVSEKENFSVPMCILQIAAMLSVYRVLAHSNAHYFSCPPEAIDPRCTFVVIYSVGDLPRINTDMKVAYYKIWGHRRGLSSADFVFAGDTFVYAATVFSN